MTAFNEYGRLERVALRHPREAFRSRDKIAREWQRLNYHAEPDFDRALAQYDSLVGIIEGAGAGIDFLPGDDALFLDSLYVRDANLISPAGMIDCAMGKAEREGEPAVAAAFFTGLDLPQAGAVKDDGKVEGGDFVWFDATTCAVAWGYRTNASGIAQLRDLLGPEVDLQVVPLPHYKGPADVFHLMSIVSPLDHDLALVYSPLMSVPFRTWLLDRGMTLVEVPDEEFASMACNVLALAPRHGLMVEGNPETRRRLEAAGCQVTLYDGSEISAKGEGGPTCLTRPLVRAA